LAVAALAAAAILLFSDVGLFMRRAQDPKLALELVGTLATGIAAVIAAFYLSLPDRSRLWAAAPLPFLALWLASSGYSCYHHWLTFGPDGWQIGESAECFTFILGASLPIGISLLLLLRRARQLTPTSVAAVGGLGAAGIAAFVLQFFHPFDVTFMDLAVHAVAIGIVVSAASALSLTPDRQT